MQDGPTQPGARVPKGASNPRRAAPPPRTAQAKPRVDRYPQHIEEWKAFADLPADERSAIYLRSIRTMMVFFVVVTVISIIATIVLVLIGISAASDTTTVNTNPFG